jgi:signal peptidase II
MKNSLAKRYVLFWLISIVSVVIDQLSKAWISSHLAIGQNIHLFGILNVTHIHNTGAAWGMFNNSTMVLTVFSVIAALAFLIFFLFFSHRIAYMNTTSFTVCFAMIFSGTVGNLIDRAVNKYVVDFISVGNFPVFNVADSYIVCGCILLAILLIFVVKDSDENKKDES